jgi:hypothetical protein
MKKKDLLFILFLIILFMPFFILADLYSFYGKFNSEHGFVMAFIKFAVLATSGELIGLRIRTGKYFVSGFGIIPRLIVWGFLGLAIKAAFMIFSVGVPPMIGYLGMENPGEILAGSFTVQKLIVAFCISLFLNMFFSPVLMTLHKITDTHIQKFNGGLNAFISPINVKDILKETDWNMHWGYVLKKTIPFFWIPAHTLTFLLPAQFQILFAALLGIVLGIILAFASVKSTDK